MFQNRNYIGARAMVSALAMMFAKPDDNAGGVVVAEMPDVETETVETGLTMDKLSENDQRKHDSILAIPADKRTPEQSKLFADLSATINTNRQRYESGLIRQLKGIILMSTGDNVPLHASLGLTFAPPIAKNFKYKSVRGVKEKADTNDRVDSIAKMILDAEEDIAASITYIADIAKGCLALMAPENSNATRTHGARVLQQLFSIKGTTQSDQLAMQNWAKSKD